MKMRTAIALLVEDELTNRLASFTLRCRDYGFNLKVLRLPAHISLKQPFVVNDFERFEMYFEEFTRHTKPQQLELDGFVFWGNAERGVVAARVTASPRLRQLHSLLNDELEQAFGESQANLDDIATSSNSQVGISFCNWGNKSARSAPIATVR